MNCTTYEYKKRNCVLLFRCERAYVYCIPFRFASGEESGNKTYFRDRNCSRVSYFTLPITRPAVTYVLTRKKAHAKNV